VSRRTEKLADLLQTTIADLIQRRLKDPALEGSLISLTHVEVAPDLSTARVHVSVLGFGDGGEVDARLREQGVLAALSRSEPFLHRELAHELYLRRVPRLRFFADHSIGEGSRLTELMRDVAHDEGRDLGEEPSESAEEPPA
jgi:ribosome-binding factor A